MSNTLTESLLPSSPKASWLNMVALTVLLALWWSWCERIPDPQVTSGHLDLDTTTIHQAAIAQIIEEVNPWLFQYDNRDSTNSMRLWWRNSSMWINIGNVHDPLVYDSNVSPSIQEWDTVYINLNHQDFVGTIDTKAEMMRDYSSPRKVGAGDAWIDIGDIAEVTGRATAVVRKVRDHQPSEIERSIYFGNQPEIKKLLEVQESK